MNYPVPSLADVYSINVSLKNRISLYSITIAELQRQEEMSTQRGRHLNYFSQHVLKISMKSKTIGSGTERGPA